MLNMRTVAVRAGTGHLLKLSSAGRCWAGSLSADDQTMADCVAEAPAAVSTEDLYCGALERGKYL